MRRRYQRGTLIERGKREPVWVGRWLVDEIRGDGTLHRRHVSEVLGTRKELPTRKLAARALEQKLAAVNSYAYSPKHVMTFAELVAKWRVDVLPNHKPSTVCSTKAHLTRLTADFGAMKLEEAFSVEVIQRWVTRQTCSPKTVRNFIATLRMIWNYASACEYAGDRSPFGRRLRLPEVGLSTKPTLTAEHARLLVQKADGEFRTMIWVVAESGCRGGELVALHIEDLDLDGRRVHIKRSAWRGTVGTTKSKKGVRRFIISRQLADHLRTYIAGLDRKEGLLFATRNGKPYDNYNLVSWKLKPLLESIGVTDHKGIGFHSLRHVNASLLDSLNVAASVRMDRLGHADFQTTMGYTHSSSQDHLDVADKLGQAFCPAADESCPSLPKPPASDTKQTWVPPVSQGA